MALSGSRYNMSFDERIKSRVDEALGPLVRQLIDEAAAERDAAVRADRELAAREIRQHLEAEADQKLHEALDAAEKRHRTAMTDGAAKAAEDVRAAVASARIEEREIEMSCASRLLESVRGLDGATSLSEVLDALGLAAAKEA